LPVCVCIPVRGLRRLVPESGLRRPFMTRLLFYRRPFEEALTGRRLFWFLGFGGSTLTPL